MSDLAASGGYYIAVAAPYIIAQPATLTGSIGIFGGKIVTGPTYEKLGASIRSLSIGRNAALESPERPFTDSERAEVRQLMRSFYDGFVGKVAQSRKMTVGRVEQIARGHVWSGAQAQQNGLVDTLGGLDRAVAIAKQRAGIPADTEVEVVNYPAPKTLYEILVERLSGQASDSQIEALLGAVQMSLGPGERQAVGLLTAPMRLFKRGEPLALMPLAFLR
jgi:protease-4